MRNFVTFFFSLKLGRWLWFSGGVELAFGNGWDDTHIGLLGYDRKIVISYIGNVAK